MNPCGGVLESRSGQFGYIYQGKFDDVSINCEWYISVQGNNPAYLKVKRLHIETSQCAQSFLEVGSSTCMYMYGVCLFAITSLVMVI